MILFQNTQGYFAFVCINIRSEKHWKKLRMVFPNEQAGVMCPHVSIVAVFKIAKHFLQVLS